MITEEVGSRLEKLLTTLKRKTIDGSIEWEKKNNDELFEVSVARSSFTIGTQDNDGVEPYVFSMYNSEGILIALINTDSDDYPEKIKNQIRALWTVINTSAAHVLRFLDQALEVLDDEPPF